MIKTDLFISTNIQRFVTEMTSGRYYLFASSSSLVHNNTWTSAEDILANTVFGKRIEASDVAVMIRRNEWRRDTVYDQYDPSIASDFTYAVSRPEGMGENYHVFRCIYNNNGSPSLQQPQFTQHFVTNLQRLTDGYVWKYLYTVTDEDMRKFSNNSYIPVIPNQEVANSAHTGIDVILLENTNNNGYEDIRSVVFARGGVVGTSFRIYLDNHELSTINDFYAGRSAYIKTPDEIDVRLYTITGSGSDDIGRFINIEDYDDIDYTIDRNYIVNIIPRIEIVGDGTGAVAIPIIEGNTIRSIEVLERGNGYTRAEARVVRPMFDFNPSDVNTGAMVAYIRPIVAPRGGHGSNVPLELRASNLMVSVSYTATDNVQKSNTYSAVSVVSDPQFAWGADPLVFDNRVALEVVSVEGVSVGEKLTQTNGFAATISAIDELNNFVYLTDFFQTTTPTPDDKAISMSWLSSLNPNLPISNGAVSLNIVNASLPVYTQRTGNVLYIRDFEPIERTDRSVEQFKILLDF